MNAERLFAGTALRNLILGLGVFAFGTILAFHNITDGDLWGKLALGASVWRQGHLFFHDPFAFTPVLPKYIDHEWGSGVVFFGLIDTFGPGALMLLKMALAFGALGFGAWVARRQRCEWNTLLFLLIPAAACLLPGYIPVVRCHAFTFFFFGLTLFCLEEMRSGRRWPAFALPAAMLLWANLHGGFVVGLAIVFFYAGVEVIERRKIGIIAGVALACAAVTLINPYGLDFWRYLIPAVLNPRARIAEWRPLPLIAMDDFWGFRILFALTIGAVICGRGQINRKNLPGLAVLALTAFMSWRSRRHGPFFAVAAMAFAGPFFTAAWARTISGAPEILRRRLNPLHLAACVYILIAAVVGVQILPHASFQPLAPLGEDPVREADILAAAGAKGNLAAPFAWGSYLSWRLFPNIKVSMDGRYEAAYPESTFALNNAFYDKQGDWQKLCRDYHVDFVILDLVNERLRPADLTAIGYKLVWQQDNLSALLALPEYAEALHKIGTNLPPTTIDPLDVKGNQLGILQRGAL